MPFLLLTGMAFSAFYALVSLFAVIVVLVTIPTADTFTIDGQPATRGEFIAFSWVVLVLFSVLSGFILATAYALWRELPWSRVAILGFWIVGSIVVFGLAIAAGLTAEELLPALLPCGVIVAVVWWYLYRKRSVAAYYRALTERQLQRQKVP